METKFLLRNAACVYVRARLYAQGLNMDTSQWSSADCFCALNSYR